MMRMRWTMTTKRGTKRMTWNTLMKTKMMFTTICNRPLPEVPTCLIDRYLLRKVVVQSAGKHGNGGGGEIFTLPGVRFRLITSDSPDLRPDGCTYSASTARGELLGGHKIKKRVFVSATALRSC